MAWKKCRAMNGPMWWRVCCNGNPSVCGHTSASLVKSSTLELRSGIKPEQQIQRESQNISPTRADSPGINPKFISPCKVSLRALINFRRGYLTSPTNQSSVQRDNASALLLGGVGIIVPTEIISPSISTYIIPEVPNTETPQNTNNQRRCRWKSAQQ